MVVQNYYNHTAATYRGLLGQLSSLFPVNGGIGWESSYEDLDKTEYFSLGDIFNNRNYETIFLDSHHRRHVSRVDDMLGKLGFMTVKTGDELSEKYLGSAEPAARDAFSDRQYFEGIVGYLKERADNGVKDTPFFMALYNFGTHAFLQRNRDIVKYGSGKNYSLNNIHSFDSAFGLFWQYIQKSPYAENTIIILTADHCHYPEKPFVMAFDASDYRGYFVDKIPYIIYDPTRILPKNYNVHNATSLDFAPSLIHYLDFGNVKNPFLGTSMYERHSNKYPHVGVSFTSEKKDFFMIDDRDIHRILFRGGDPGGAEVVYKYITITQQLEELNRLWEEATE